MTSVARPLSPALWEGGLLADILGACCISWGNSANCEVIRVPKWGRPIELNQEAKQFIQATREGFLEGDWSFLAQKTRGNCYFTNPLRTSHLGYGCDRLRLANRCNVYITANAFSSNQGHKAQYLFAMHNLVADIDCHAGNISEAARKRQIENLVHAVKHSYSDYALLEPNFIVYTGRGVQFWWHHEGLSVRSNMWTWESVARRIQVCLETILCDLGDDPVDGCSNLKLDSQASFNPAGLYRLPGTVNQATGEAVHYETCSTHTYTLAELKEFRAEIPIVPKPFVPNTIKDTRTWGRQMLDKVVALRAYRDAPVGEELRNNFCFVFHCLMRTAGYGKDYSRQQTSDFNDGFKQPLREGELRSSLSATAHKDYRLSTKAIIRILEITPGEQKALGIGCNLKKLQRQERIEQAKKEKAKLEAEVVRQYKAGLPTTEISRGLNISRTYISKIVKEAGVENPKAERDRQIIKLRQDGWMIAQIAEKVGCSDRTVFRVLENAKQNAITDETDPGSEGRSTDVSFFYMAVCLPVVDHTHNGCLSDRGGPSPLSGLPQLPPAQPSALVHKSTCLATRPAAASPDAAGPLTTNQGSATSPLTGRSVAEQSAVSQSSAKRSVCSALPCPTITTNWVQPEHSRLRPANGKRWTLRLDGWRRRSRGSKRTQPSQHPSTQQKAPSDDSGGASASKKG